MIAVIQRVARASVNVGERTTAECGEGLLILLGVADSDDESDAEVLAEKIPKLRIFSDENGKMNLSLTDVGGEAIVVSNFTLLANYRHGNRPDFFAAAKPTRADELYMHFVACLEKRVKRVGTGEFGADMLVHIENSGPVTMVLQSEILKKG